MTETICFKIEKEVFNSAKANIREKIHKNFPGLPEAKIEKILKKNADVIRFTIQLQGGKSLEELLIP